MNELKKLLLIIPVLLCCTRLMAGQAPSDLLHGRQLLKRYQRDEALAFFYRGYASAAKEKDLRSEGECALEIADLLLQQNKVDSIDYYYGIARQVSEKLNLQAELIRARTGLLEMPRRTNPSATMDQYLELLSEARKQADRSLYYIVLDKVITVNYAMENYKQAIAQAQECAGFYAAQHDTFSLAVKLRVMGNLYFTQNKDSSLFYYHKALPLFYSIGNWQNIVYTYQSLGWLTYENQLETALIYLRSADSIDRIYHIGSTQLPLIMSFALSKKGKINEAIAAAKRSYELGWNAKQLFIAFQSANALAGYYKSLKEIDSAMRYTELYAFIKDSIRSEKQFKDAGRMQAKMEYDKALLQEELRQGEALKRQHMIRNFSMLAIGLLLVIVVLVYRAYIINRRIARIISLQNEEKSVLLREIHHRVKNNLSIISGILDLQQRNSKDEVLLNAFKDAKARIGSMSLVHQNLYEQEHLSGNDPQAYFQKLYEAVSASYQPRNKRIAHHIECRNVSINLDTLIPLALITNELLTNTFKYAFEGRSEGHISIQLTQKETGFYYLYADDGVGMPAGSDAREGLGSRLIKGLCRQLNGNLNKTVAERGIIYHIAFTGINNS